MPAQTILPKCPPGFVYEEETCRYVPYWPYEFTGRDATYTLLNGERWHQGSHPNDTAQLSGVSVSTQQAVQASHMGPRTGR